MKKEEQYTNGVLSYVEYFLDLVENELEIRDQYLGILISFYKDELIQGNYRKYNVED